MFSLNFSLWLIIFMRKLFFPFLILYILMFCVSQLIVGLLNAVIYTFCTFFAVYRVLISTGYGRTTDKVSIILVGQGGAETGIHDLPGEFGFQRQVSVESLESLSKPRRQQQRERHQTKGLMSRTIDVCMHHTYFVTVLASYAKQQCEMINFCVFWRK